MALFLGVPLEGAHVFPTMGELTKAERQRINEIRGIPNKESIMFDAINAVGRMLFWFSYFGSVAVSGLVVYAVGGMYFGYLGLDDIGRALGMATASIDTAMAWSTTGLGGSVIARMSPYVYDWLVQRKKAKEEAQANYLYSLVQAAMDKATSPRR